jgi:methionyl-tRNA formyltransferase
MMKIIFISGVTFGYSILESILEKNWKITASFSYLPEKKKFYSDYANFKNLTKKYDITHIQVNNINDQENINLIKKINPDLILVMGWSQILKSEILKIPKLGVIGSHPTELPKYRGRAPIPWSILKGLKTSALTFFLMKDGIDDGDILDQQFFQILDSDDATSLYDKITQLGKKMLDENLCLITSGIINPIKQDSNKFIEYWNKRTPEDGRINWKDTGITIHNLIRASTKPYPGAFTMLQNKKLIIWRSELINNENNTPGKILDVSKHDFKIGTTQGTILVKEFTYDEKISTNPLEIFSNNTFNQILDQSHE